MTERFATSSCACGEDIVALSREDVHIEFAVKEHVRSRAHQTWRDGLRIAQNSTVIDGLEARIRDLSVALGALVLVSMFPDGYTVETRQAVARSAREVLDR